jgi:hypothetical protein
VDEAFDPASSDMSRFFSRARSILSELMACPITPWKFSMCKQQTAAWLQHRIWVRIKFPRTV